jgi:transcriptional regulator with XRE-family HTH domain
MPDISIGMLRKNEGAQALIKARKRKGLSQVLLAVQSGLSLPTVSLAERTGCFSARTAERLAAVLGVPVESLRGSGSSPTSDAAMNAGQDTSSGEGA